MRERKRRRFFGDYAKKRKFAADLDIMRGRRQQADYPKAHKVGV